MKKKTKLIIDGDVNKIMRKNPFKSETRQCTLCNKLFFSVDDYIKHFREGDGKHKLFYFESLSDVKI